MAPVLAVGAVLRPCLRVIPVPAQTANSDAAKAALRTKIKEAAFSSQSTFVLPVEGKPGHFIYMGDRWNQSNLADPRYVWRLLMSQHGASR